MTVSLLLNKQNVCILDMLKGYISLDMYIVTLYVSSDFHRSIRGLSVTGLF